MPPLINVSMALNSPMLADRFAVIRRQQTIGNNGRAAFNATNIPAVSGVVYPSTRNDLERFPNFQVTGKTITVITRFALRSESETHGADYAPDIVLWHGDNFLVSALEDWSNFGPGYVMAICASTDFKDVPPTTE
jgi:hypothetical protein